MTDALDWPAYKAASPKPPQDSDGPARQAQEDIGQVGKIKISQVANPKIPQMADVSGGFLLYTGRGQKDGVDRARPGSIS